MLVWGCRFSAAHAVGWCTAAARLAADRELVHVVRPRWLNHTNDKTAAWYMPIPSTLGIWGIYHAIRRYHGTSPIFPVHYQYLEY